MIIQIELIVVVVLILLLLIWSLWFNLTTYLNKRRYKPQNDKARRGQERTGIDRVEEPTGIVRPEETEHDTSRPTQPTERELLQTADTVLPGKDSNIPRNPFRRRKRF